MAGCIMMWPVCSDVDNIVKLPFWHPNHPALYNVLH